jgi:hypothetical protein
VFGTLVGFFLFWDVFTAGELGWVTLPIVPLFFGLLAAFWGDDFWHFLLGLFRWLRWY